MHRPNPLPATVRAFAAGVLACGLAAPADAQLIAPDYALTAPTWLLPGSHLADSEIPPGLSLATWGPLRLAAAGSSSGTGLSLEAGAPWFARAGLGRSLDASLVSLGGGYRFAAGDAVSMQFTRQSGRERLGLAVRYDWQSTWLRLSYEQQQRAVPGTPDLLRFSAGVRF
ncbi:MAG: hypothetical protein KGL68_08970 [Burkholderiales bacterium]|nr:hypothetical protein [Burkholderiales bacterium]